VVLSVTRNHIHWLFEIVASCQKLKRTSSKPLWWHAAECHWTGDS